MPFAPSVLDRSFDELVLDHGKTVPAYMMVSYDASPTGRSSIPAALHRADFTLRPQRVTQAANPAYYRVIEAFADITGVGAVLNTSFNIHGEPIVGSPMDAISTVLRSGLDYLALNSFLLKKREAA